MKILISGGTGMVGTELGKHLAKLGHEILILTRSAQKARLDCPFPNTPITYDELEEHPSLKSLDAIINLAGANINGRRWNKKYKQELYDSRIETTQQLVKVANRSPNLKTFVSTSAVGIYGDTGEASVNEDHGLSYEFLGKLCQDWEGALNDLDDRIRPVVFRVGIVFSERGGALKEMSAPIQAGVGGALGRGDQLMSWIDIEDLVALYTFALENPIQGVFNAVAPNPASNKEISQIIADELGTKLFMNVPFFALKLVTGQIAHHLVESQNISSEKVRNKGFSFQFKKAEESIKKRVPKLKGMARRFIFEQWIPKQKEEIFPFFSDAYNLEKITPDSLNFQILKVSDNPVQEGSLIDYKLRIDGIPVRWQTLITSWNPPHAFADNQQKGPYKKWFHVHKFEDFAGGTLMTDQVDLELPLGALGYGVASWKVLRDVKNIFEYRRKVIYNLFCQ